MNDPTSNPTSAQDSVDQLQSLHDHVERSLELLEPYRDRCQAQYDRLRALRDQLEDAFVVQQTSRLRAGEGDFAKDVAQLHGIVTNLEAATRRAARAQEIVSYISAAVELVSGVVARVLPAG